MRRIAGILAALLTLALAGSAEELGRPAEDAVPEPSPVFVSPAELERVQRERSEAIRTDVAIGKELERLPQRRTMDRLGGPGVRWGLWDTY